MVDIFRYTDIAEAGVPILNPLTADKLLLLGEFARLRPGMHQLDLACGKGEMLCQYADRYGITGVGIDIHPPFLDAARTRAVELGVGERLEFFVGDAGQHDIVGTFDVVSCIGATWIGGGFVGAVELMQRSLAPGGRLLVGEVFFDGPSPEDAASRYDGSMSDIGDLGSILDRTQACGMDVTEMVIATREDWDQYSSRQWDRAYEWLRHNPDHPDAGGIRDWVTRGQRDYLADERNWLGWGVFVLR